MSSTDVVLIAVLSALFLVLVAGTALAERRAARKRGGRR